MESRPSPAPAIEVYVRELAPKEDPELRAFLDRIDRLASTDTIADSTVHVVGDEICPETAEVTDAGGHICQRMSEFSRWAEASGKRLDPFFRTTDVDRTITDEEYTKISFPTVAIAEYVDEELQFVTPCMDGDTTITPRERIDALATSTRSWPPNTGQ